MIVICCPKMDLAIIGKKIEEGGDSSVANVNGCCGGGCYVIMDLLYCPWCGKEIEVKPA